MCVGGGWGWRARRGGVTGYPLFPVSTYLIPSMAKAITFHDKDVSAYCNWHRVCFAIVMSCASYTVLSFAGLCSSMLCCICLPC